MNTLIKRAETNNLVWLQVRIHSLLGHYYLNQIHQYEYCLVHLTKAANLMDGLPFEEYPFKYACNAHLGTTLFKFEDYKSALIYFRKSISSEVNDIFTRRTVSSYNSIGLIYRKFNQLDSADYYFYRALEASRATNNRWWEGIASGNLGENHFLRGEYDKAIPLLELDLERAEESHDWGLASNSLVLLGDIALKQHNTKKAHQLLNKARSYAYEWKDWKRLSKLYPRMAKLAGQEGNGALVALYTDSTLIVNDSLRRVRGSLLTTRTEQKLARERHLKELRTIELERENEVLQRNVILALLLLIMLLSVFVLYHFWNRFNSKKKELTDAKKKLFEFTKQLADRNKQVAELRATASATADNSIIELQKATILTSNDWTNFQKLFNSVHAGFLTRITQKYPSLSQAEIRFAVLSKLQLKDSEMAAMLGVGDDAIRQYRSRLRRKLNLNSKEELQQLIESI